MLHVKMEDGTFRKTDDNPEFCNNRGRPCLFQDSIDNAECEKSFCPYIRDIEKQKKIYKYFTWGTHEELQWLDHAGKLELDDKGQDTFRYDGTSVGDRYVILSNYEKACENRTDWGEIDKVKVLAHSKELLRREYNG
jgi:hypothetical protein